MWESPAKPVDLAEQRLSAAILDGTFPPESLLPPERDLAGQLGVTRPTLREALQRLRRDGWIDTHHGRPTRVRDWRTEGRLGVLATLVEHPEHLSPRFVPDLLGIRELLAPAYARLAVERDSERVRAALEACGEALLVDAEACARADWELHRQLTIASGNPIFTLILNGFEGLYLSHARRYFDDPAGRALSGRFYARLRVALDTRDLDAAESITRQTMRETRILWEQAHADEERP